MHPAYSVIFFTVASGAGFGLLGIAAIALLLGAEPSLLSGVLALALIGGGTLSSTFHLGRPERAWRAFSQGRSSWLSREGILAAATVPVCLWFFAALYWQWVLAMFAAVVALLLAVATVVATAMIYATIKPVRQWRDPWVVPGYLAGAFASGAAVWAALDAGVAGRVAALVALAAWAAVKLFYWRSIDRPQTGPDIGSATGLGKLGTVRPLDPPHTEENYLQREMGFRIARKHAARLRRLALLLGAIVPGLLLLVSFLVTPFAIIAALSALIGLLVERWLFFAEARHTVMLYYGTNVV